MNYSIELSYRAKQELKETIGWYQTKDLELGIRFHNQLKTILRKIKNNPFQYPEKRSPFREKAMSRFPYIIVYEIYWNEITVYSIFHIKQHPDKKLPS